MTPEPTPVSGTVPPNGSVVTPVAVIRTTAGLTFAAALTTAEESSTGIGPCVEGTTGWLAAGLPVRSSAPVPSRTRTVPPEASTAESRAAARIVPAPGPPRPVPRFGDTGPIDATGCTAGTGSSVGEAHAGRCSGIGA